MGTGLVIAITVVVIIGLVAQAGKAQPRPGQRDQPGGGGGGTPATPVDLFLAGERCLLDGQPYNAAQWPGPPEVISALRELGYEGKNENIQSAGWVNEIKRFQALARSLGFPGMVGAPASFIDGEMGPCTLRALTHAMGLLRDGRWPGP